MTKIPQLSGLAKRLISDELISDPAIQEATNAASSQKIPLVTYLVQNDLVNPNQLAQIAADEFGTPIVQLSALDPETFPKELISEALIRKHRALPLYKRGTRLFIAVSDPTNLHAVDEIKFNTGLNIETVVTAENKLNEAIESFLYKQNTTLDAGLYTHLTQQEKENT